MTERHYTAAQLKVMIQDTIIRQEWEPAFAPPEGQFGQGGADPDTELKGFKKDAQSMIVEPMLNAFRSGGTSTEIGEALTAIAYQQQNASAGAFARNMALNIRDRLAPNFLEQKLDGMVQRTSPTEAMAQLERNITSPDGQEIMANLAARTINSPNTTMEKLLIELDDMAREYDNRGDDFMAEEADMVKDRVQQIITADNKKSADPSMVQKLKSQERNWENPIQVKPLGTTSALPPKISSKHMKL